MAVMMKKSVLGTPYRAHGIRNERKTAGPPLAATARRRRRLSSGRVREYEVGCGLGERQEHQQVIPRKRRASRRRRVIRTRYMQKNGTTRACDRWVIVVAQNDDDVVEIIVHPELFVTCGKGQCYPTIVVRMRGASHQPSRRSIAPVRNGDTGLAIRSARYRTWRIGQRPIGLAPSPSTFFACSAQTAAANSAAPVLVSVGGLPAIPVSRYDQIQARTPSLT